MESNQIRLHSLQDTSHDSPMIDFTHGTKLDVSTLINFVCLHLDLLFCLPPLFHLAFPANLARSENHLR